MCTVYFRINALDPLDLELAATRDIPLERPWLPPGDHWGLGIRGGLDLQAGGTWLCVSDQPPRIALVVNGPTAAGANQNPGLSRGNLPLRAMAERLELLAPGLDGYPGFHLLLAGPDGVGLLSWNGFQAERVHLARGRRTLTWGGLNDETHPRVARFRPLFDALPAMDSDYSPWKNLFRAGSGDRAADDELIIRRGQGASAYGTVCVSLVRLRPARARFEHGDTRTSPDPRWNLVFG